MAAQDYEQVTYNSPSGAQMGQSATEKVGFFGAVPVVQPTCTAIGTTTISQVGTTGKWAFATSTAATAFVARVIALQDRLDALGLVDQI
jgi:hypothetical protein